MVKANWRDNPWFPSVLEEERELDLAKYPDRYHHMWEGEYVRAFEGAYFASVLSQARKEGRIGNPLRAFWDIGGAGAKADAMALDCAMSGQEFVSSTTSKVKLLHQRATPSRLQESDLLSAA